MFDRFRELSEESVESLEAEAGVQKRRVLALKTGLDSKIVDGLIVNGLGNGCWNEVAHSQLIYDFAKEVMVLITSTVPEGSVDRNHRYEGKMVASKRLKFFEARLLFILSILFNKSSNTS